MQMNHLEKSQFRFLRAQGVPAIAAKARPRSRRDLYGRGLLSMTRAQWEGERAARLAGFRSLADLARSQARAARLSRLDYWDSLCVPHLNFQVKEST